MAQIEAFRQTPGGPVRRPRLDLWNRVGL